jgi:hypothetical protein
MSTGAALPHVERRKARGGVDAGGEIHSRAGIAGPARVTATTVVSGGALHLLELRPSTTVEEVPTRQDVDVAGEPCPGSRM